MRRFVRKTVWDPSRCRRAACITLESRRSPHSCSAQVETRSLRWSSSASSSLSARGDARARRRRRMPTVSSASRSTICTTASPSASRSARISGGRLLGQVGQAPRLGRGDVQVAGVERVPRAPPARRCSRSDAQNDGVPSVHPASAGRAATQGQRADDTAGRPAHDRTVTLGPPPPARGSPTRRARAPRGRGTARCRRRARRRPRRRRRPTVAGPMPPSTSRSMSRPVNSIILATSAIFGSIVSM